jgi:hypothetical protein
MFLSWYLIPKCTLATKTGCHGIAEIFYQWHKALLKQIRLQWEHGERQ